MVNKIKLLENLEARFSTGRKDVDLLEGRAYTERYDLLEKTRNLMINVYGLVKRTHPNEPIVKLIRDNYENDWDALFIDGPNMGFFHNVVKPSY